MKQRKCKIQIGDKYGKLTIISRLDNCITSSKEIPRWECKCDCGNNIIVLAPYLLRGRKKDCGCVYDITPKNHLKSQDKYNRLTLIKYYKGRWECQCECGKITTLTSQQITSGNTKSCGCLNKEQNIKKAAKLIAARRKYEPRIASAMRVWKQYKYRDPDFIVSFDNWLKISQEKCYYCGIEPNSHYNMFNDTNGKSSKYGIDNGLFSYNGLDRIDSNKSHSLDNIVTCCYMCNRSKNNLDLNIFLNKIQNFHIRKFKPIKIKSLKIKNSHLGASIKTAFYLYKNDTDLNVEEFYYISQLPCYYCNTPHSNKCQYTNKHLSAKVIQKSILLYNGIDRIDSNKGHTKDNIVPCCKYCNFAKGNLSVEDFNSWIQRIQTYQNIKK